MPPTITPTPTADAVITAARQLALRWQITPRWDERLTPEARRLVEAVLDHDRTETGMAS